MSTKKRLREACALTLSEHRELMKIEKGFVKVQAEKISAIGFGFTQVPADGWICRLDRQGARYGAGFTAEVRK
mgnify:CR=1 FL=1